MSEEILSEVIEEPFISEPEEVTPEPEETPQEPEEEKVPKGVQKRLDKATWEKHEAKREADRERARAIQLEIELERLKRNEPREEAKTLPNGSPDPSKYPAGEYDTEFIAAKIDYQVTQRIEKMQAQQKAQQKAQQVMQLEAQTREVKPDYDEATSVVLTHNLSKVQQFREIIMDADNPAELTYYLGKNPDELDRIASMTPQQAIRYIGRIEAKLVDTPSPEPAKKPVSSAPKPIAPLGSAKSSAVATNPAEAKSMDEYVRLRKQQQK